MASKKRSKQSTENTTHDQNFKNLILDYPIEAIEFYAPEAAKNLPLQQLKITPIR